MGPDDMNKMIFWEAYALTVPIFTPAVEHLARMIPFFDYYHFTDKHLPLEVRLFAARSGANFPVEPFGLSAPTGKGDKRTQEERLRAPLQALFRAGLSDFVQYPHVQRFDSIPSLIAGLLSCDLPTISSAMRQEHARRSTRGGEVWRALLELMHVGMPSATK